MKTIVYVNPFEMRPAGTKSDKDEDLRKRQFCILR